MQNRIPYVEQFNLTLEREILRLRLERQLRWRALPKSAMVAEIDQALPDRAQFSPAETRTSFPAFPRFRKCIPPELRNYHSLQTSVEHRFNNGFNLIRNYT